MPGATSRHRKRFLAASLVLAAAAIALFVAQTRGKGFEWQVFLATAQGVDLGWLGLSVAFSYSTYVVRALRWAVLLQPLCSRPPFRKLLSATVIGYSAVTALGRPAEMVRPYLIASKTDVPFSSQVAAWVVERIYDSLIALAVFGFALSQVDASALALGTALSWVLRTGGILIGLGSAACLTALFAMRYRSQNIQCWVLRSLGFLARHHLERAERMVTGFLEGVSATKSQAATVRLVAWTLTEWLLIGACYACVLRAFGGAARFTPIGVLILMGFVSFGSLVQLPAVGGGAQVTAMLVLTEIFGVPIEIATGMGLLLWFISFVAIVPMGAAMALHEGLTWARIREAEGGTPA